MVAPQSRTHRRGKPQGRETESGNMVGQHFGVVVGRQFIFADDHRNDVRCRSLIDALAHDAQRDLMSPVDGESRIDHFVDDGQQRPEAGAKVLLQ